MAYAAGLDDSEPRYFDTTQPLRVHPLYPVCLEWDAVLALRHGPETESLSPEEQARAVHAEHDLHLIRPIRPGMRLQTVARAIQVEQRKPGASLIKRIDTRDETGALVCRTFQHTLYRDVALKGAPRRLENIPAWPVSTRPATARVPLTIPPGAAHIYTECARIWNPIHTDRAHAQAAGFADIILHGTATLARAVSSLMKMCLPDSPHLRVTRLGCRFTGMVNVPSTLTLRLDGADERCINFSVLNDSATEVISRGFLCIEGGHVVRPGALSNQPIPS